MEKESNKVLSLAERVRPVLPAGADIKETIEQFRESIEQEIDELVALRDAGESVIPEVSFTQLSSNGFTDDQKALIHKRGCVVVRGVIDEQQASTWNQDIENYLDENRYYEDLAESIKEGDAARAKLSNMLDIFWSPSQVQMRQSQQIHDVQLHLNNLWTFADSSVQVFDPNKMCTYSDRVRIRQPGDQSHGLAPHVDSCSLEPWITSDSIFNTFKTLLHGDWQSFDPFDAVNRVSTEQKPHPTACGMFRTFQGWMALTPQGADCGTLQLVPSSRCVAWMFLNMLKCSLDEQDLAYPLPNEAYLLHEEQHAALIKGLCSIPDMKAGDTVWWHPDVVHGVESSNQSTITSSVVYLGSAPDCARNRAHLAPQLSAFGKGLTPPDYPVRDIEAEYKNRATESELTPLGRAQMGLPV